MVFSWIVICIYIYDHSWGCLVRHDCLSTKERHGDHSWGCLVRHDWNKTWGQKMENEEKKKRSHDRSSLSWQRDSVVYWKRTKRKIINDLHQSWQQCLCYNKEGAQEREGERERVNDKVRESKRGRKRERKSEMKSTNETNETQISQMRHKWDKWDPNLINETNETNVSHVCLNETNETHEKNETNETLVRQMWHKRDKWDTNATQSWIWDKWHRVAKTHRIP